MFDVTSRDTFTCLDAWVREIYQYADPHVTFILCGNKCKITPPSLLLFLLFLFLFLLFSVVGYLFLFIY